MITDQSSEIVQVVRIIQVDQFKQIRVVNSRQKEQEDGNPHAPLL